MKGLIFAAGVAVGAVAAYFCLKEKFEERYQNDLESLKRVYNRHNKTETEKKKVVSETEEKTEDVEKDRPYVISPEEFGSNEDYETIDLTYYRDGVLTDDDNDPMDDDNIEEVIGKDALNHFGEYEDDSVYVRNDHLQCDYAIILNQMRYTESVPPYKKRR